ncbi:MAG: DUF2207 domain-containing protein, partial [Anaerolineae bacterium]|nr:DUF2207 domain-containing protein [Anaerolineae bacterium]
MKRYLSVMVLVGAALALLVAPAAAAEKSYVATRYDVAATVEAGGDLLVTETVTYAFYGEPFTYVFRELETGFSDGVTVLDVAMDGESLPAGTDAGRAEIRGERVTWHMAPTVDESHTFTLRYRLHGVVRQDERGDLLRFQILPTEHAFEILESDTTLTFPPGVRPVGDVAVVAGSGSAARVEDGVVVTAGQVAADTSLAIEVVFPAGSVISEPPAWQARQITQREAAPWWLLAGGMVIVAVSGAFFAAYRRLQPPSVPARGSERVYEPPADVPPAYAGALASAGARAQWQHALATLFDLAEREVVEIEEKPRTGLFGSRDFIVRRLGTTVELAPHEDALLALLFEGKHGRDEEVRFSKLQQRVTGRRWKAFEETLWQELKQAGLVSEVKRAAGKRLTLAGIVVLLFGTLLFPVLLLAFDAGAAALVVPIGFLVAGTIGIVLGQAVKPLTAQGVQAAATWKPFADYLKQVTKGRAAVTRPDTFARYLSYAAAFGLLQNWARHFQREGVTAAPVWFHAAAAAGEDSSMAAFVAMS